MADASSVMSQDDDTLDRQMLRQLLKRYGREGVAQLMEEEETTQSGIQNDGASIVSAATFSSVKSEETPPSVFDTASIRTFSSDNSSVRHSIMSNLSARSAKLLGRRPQSATSVPTPTSAGRQPSLRDDDTASIAPSVAPSVDSATSVTSTGAPKQKGSFTCGFCREEDIQKTCTRKNDLKRHIEDFHNMNAQWFCRHRGCTMVFDWQTAYKTHLKQAHGGARITLDEAKINLCPQTIFACGFENCTQVFEAPSDDDADSMFKEFVGHVVKHFDEGTNSGEWSYSARMRNLLKQTGLAGAWANSVWAAEEDRGGLIWQPQSSGTLRKLLETRHLGDLQSLIQYAIALGTEPDTLDREWSKAFVTPVKDECRQPIIGHKSRVRPLPPSGPVPEAAPDFQFHIPRNTNPNYAAYLNQQRRVYSNRPGPVRTGRSARPPRAMAQHVMPPNGMQPPQFRYTNMQPQGHMFNIQQQQQQQQQHHQQQQQQQQQFVMMAQSNGGIIAEDMRNLRNMAGNGSDDIEMGEPDMMDAGFVSDQQQMSAPFMTKGIQSQAPDGSCLTPSTMEQQMAFGNYDPTHAY